MGWLSQLFNRQTKGKGTPAPQTPASARTPSTAPRVAAAPIAVPAVPAVPEAIAGAPPPCIFLPWLAKELAFKEDVPSQQERALLATLTALLKQARIPAALLPRTAQLIPQLVAMMRGYELPIFAMAKKISRDPVLVTEVLRLANSPLYRVGEPVENLEDAIAHIGQSGLNCCISKVLFKPIVRDGAAGIDSVQAQRLWDRGDQLAQRCAGLASQQRIAPLDGYLVGLLSGTGWNIALAAWRQSGQPLPGFPTWSFALQAEAAAMRLFGQAAQEWAITEGFLAFGKDLYAKGLTSATHPLAQVLRQAQDDVRSAPAGR